MALTKEQIIEIQTAAEFNYHSHRRKVQEEEERKKTVKKRIAEFKDKAKKPKAEKKES